MYCLKREGWHQHLPEGETLKLGRATGSDVVCDDSKASRYHGEFKVENGQLSFRDLESTNGTEINGRSVKPWVWNILAEGDGLRIGEWTVIVEKSEHKVESSGERMARPMVDPAGPASALEPTGAMKIPPEL